MARPPQLEPLAPKFRRTRVEIVRQPPLGEPIVWRHWAVVGAITVVGCSVALLCMRNYRSRVAYWV